MKKRLPVVVTTKAPSKGVFFGYAEGEYDGGKTIRIFNARMCVYWSADVRSVVGLASSGPSKSCKISPAVPAVFLEDVECVMTISPEAAKKFEDAPWH